MTDPTANPGCLDVLLRLFSVLVIVGVVLSLIL